MCRTSGWCSIRLYPSQRTLSQCWNFPDPSGQTSGCVYHERSGPNHGPTLKTQLVFLTEYCMSCQIGNAHLCIESVSILVCVCWWHQIGWTCVGRWWNTLILGSGRRFLIACVWDTFKPNINQTKVWWMTTAKCSNRECMQEQQQSYSNQRTWWKTFLRGLTTCVERYCEVANKITEQLFKVSTQCADDHHSKKKNWKRWDKGQTHTLKSSWNVCIWFALADQTFSLRTQIGTSTHKMDKSLWRTFGSCDFVHSQFEWLHTICHVEHTAQHCRLGLFQDSDCAGDWRLKIDMETLKNRHQGEEFSVSSGVEQSFPLVRCARNKLQSHTFLLNLRLYL